MHPTQPLHFSPHTAVHMGKDIDMSCYLQALTVLLCVISPSPLRLQELGQ